MNTEREITISISGDDSLAQTVGVLLANIKVNIRGNQSRINLTKSSEEAVDLKIFVGSNLKVKQISEIFKDKSELSYLIHVIPSEGSDQARLSTKTAILQKALKFNSFCRELHFEDLKSEIIQEDLLNLLYLVSAPEETDEKKFIIKRYIESNVFSEEFALYLVRAGCLRKQTMEKDEVARIFPVSFSKVIFPRKSFDHLRTINKVQNHLWMKISNDPEFLIQSIETIADSDPFIKNLLEIAKKVKESSVTQTANLCYSRNDFFLGKNGQYLQIEPNLYGVGFGPMADRLEHGLGDIDSQFGMSYPKNQKETLMSENETCLAGGLEAAWCYYGNKDAVVVLVSSKHTNSFDMFASAKKLGEKGISLMRYSFEELNDLMEVDQVTGIATVLDREIAVFYYRDGLLPECYNESTWITKEKMELSKAIKAPNIFYQLSNTKYLQYLMGKKETWLRYGFSEDTFKEHNKFFPESFIISDFANCTDKMSEYTKQNGGISSWVLKPQRDCGGNNLFGNDIESFLNTKSVSEISSYILQKKIDMMTRTGIQCNWKHTLVRTVDDEIGLFHCILSDKGQLLSEIEGGAMIWTKFNHLNEAGDSDTEFATFSSFSLVD